MAALRVQEVEADSAGFRAFGPDAVANRLLRIVGNQAFEGALGLLSVVRDFETGGGLI